MTTTLTVQKARSDRIKSLARNAPRISNSGLYIPRIASAAAYVPRVAERGRVDLIAASSAFSFSTQGPPNVTPNAALFEGPFFPDGVLQVNVRNAPYNAGGDGTTNDTTALQNACSDVIAAGGGWVYAPAGTYRYRGQILQNNANVPFRFYGDGPGLTTLKLDNDLGGAPTFGVLSRGAGTNDLVAMQRWDNFSITNPNAHKGDIWNLWQCDDAHWESINVTGVIGSAWIATTCNRPYILNCNADGCGDRTSGSQTLYWKYSDEGGTVHGKVNYGTIRGSSFTNNTDIGVAWRFTQNCIMDEVVVSGSGELASPFEGLDCFSCSFVDSSFLNGTDDCAQMTSQGSSFGNIFDGCTFAGALGHSVGTGYGLNWYSANASQTHLGNTVSNYSATGNVAGAIGGTY